MKSKQSQFGAGQDLESDVANDSSKCVLETESLIGGDKAPLPVSKHPQGFINQFDMLSMAIGALGQAKGAINDHTGIARSSAAESIGAMEDKAATEKAITLDNISFAEHTIMKKDAGVDEDQSWSVDEAKEDKKAASNKAIHNFDSDDEDEDDEEDEAADHSDDDDYGHNNPYGNDYFGF